jgi:hypothetical protein
MKFVSLTIPALLFCVFSASAQNGVFGRVVDAQTHAPLRRAMVHIQAAKVQRDDITDGEGRFRFDGLAPANYALIAHRDGYSDRAYIVERSDFDAGKELPIELHAQGIVAGKVTDRLGLGIESARIEALRADPAGKWDVAGSAETNDQGQYRLAGLDPGVYRIRARYQRGRSSEFDSTPLAIASSFYESNLQIKAGSSVDRIDFLLNAVTPVKISGEIISENRIFTEPVGVWIAGQAGEGGHNDTAENGKFSVADLAPGVYTFSAETLKRAQPMFGLTTVNVGASDVVGVKIAMLPIPAVSGEIRFEGGSAPDLRSSGVYFTATDQVSLTNMRIAHPDATSRFSIYLIPGDYNVALDGPLNKLRIDGITLDGKPVTNWRVHIERSSVAQSFVIRASAGGSK